MLPGGPYDDWKWWTPPVSLSWVAGHARCDTTTTNLEGGTLFRYVPTATVFRCPADRSRVENQPHLPRNLSYLLSLGLTAPERAQPIYSVLGVGRVALSGTRFRTRLASHPVIATVRHGSAGSHERNGVGRALRGRRAPAPSE